jgi:biopolymer transport protein ExbB
MHITEHFLAFTLLGAEWVLWLLIFLSVISFAIMIERAWFFATHRLDTATLESELRRLLAENKLNEARARVQHSPTVEAGVIRAGLAEVERGHEAVGAALFGAKARQRLRLERNLAFLGTLGNNAPFIGLFGTVLGIIKAFHDLAGNQAGGVAVVMSGISEALVSTAVGLLVAIPAVVGFNFFNRRVRATIANVDSLAHVVLAQLKGEDEPAEAPSVKAPSKEKPGLAGVAGDAPSLSGAK